MSLDLRLIFYSMADPVFNHSFSISLFVNPLLQVLALGAQVPDLFGSVAVAKQGEGPSAISNAVGAQVMGLTLGVAVPFLVRSYVVGTDVSLGIDSI